MLKVLSWRFHLVYTVSNGTVLRSTRGFIRGYRPSNNVPFLFQMWVLAKENGSVSLIPQLEFIRSIRYLGVPYKASLGT